MHQACRTSLIGLTLLLCALPAAAVNCGDILTGGVHTLTADLDCSAAEPLDALWLDSATLDMAGYTVTAKPDGIAIVLVGQGSQVSGGTISADYGVSVSGVGGHQVSDLTIHGHIVAVSLHSTQNTVARVHTAGDHGLVVGYGASQNRLIDTRITAALTAIQVYGPDNVLRGNVASTLLDGVIIEGDRNILMHHTLTQDSGAVWGIGVEVSGQGNLILGSRASGFAWGGLDAHGDCAHNTWRANRVRTADPSCILGRAVAIR